MTRHQFALQVTTMTAMLTYSKLTGQRWGALDASGAFVFDKALLDFVSKVLLIVFERKIDAGKACRKNRELFVRVASGDRQAIRDSHEIFELLPPELRDMEWPTHH
jgi:hypothetical protein